MRIIKRQQGLSLIEVMVALILSLFLIGGVLQIYLSNKSNYRLTEELARVQENGRFALEMITRDTRMADYWGCAGVVNKANVSNALNFTPGDDFDFTGNTGIAGVDDSNPATPDELILRGAFGASAFLMGTPASQTANLEIATGNDLEIGDIVMVGDCENSDIFQISNIIGSSTEDEIEHATGGTGTPGNATPTLSKIYQEDAQIMRVASFRYHVAPGINGEPALFRQTDGGVDNELVSGVENFQVLFGEDTDGDRTANRYVSADAPPDFNNIVSIRLNLLIRSLDDNVVKTPQVYSFAGAAPVTAPDNRLRHVFTSTIAVRNKAL